MTEFAEFDVNQERGFQSWLKVNGIATDSWFMVRVWTDEELEEWARKSEDT